MMRLRLTIIVFLLTGLSFLAVGLNTIVRQDEVAPDPFTAYASVLRGSINDEFICKDLIAINDEMKLDAARIMCTTSPTDGIFSQVRVITTRKMYQVDFSLRSERLTVGDLARLWGRPQRGSVLQGRLNLRWPEYGMTALVSVNHLFSYFLPVERIIFTDRESHSSLNSASILMTF